MPVATLDLDAYFERIGHRGERAPTLATLQAIVARHAQAIPFENLNPLLGWPVRLDLASLQRKLVHERRGGYCFEHNLLLWEVLRTLGYTVSGLAARVRWNAPADAVTARNHMLLRIELAAGTHIADVGFGGMTLTAPLRLVAGTEQATPHEPFRLAAAGGDAFTLQALLRGEWKPLYVFDLQPQLPIDYEAANWYLSTHPQSHFVNGLMAARPLPDRRHALQNDTLTVHHLGGGSERRVLESPAQLREVLQGLFGIALPDTPALDDALAGVIARAAAQR